MRFAVFADIHGKFLLPFKLAAHYQEKSGKKIDLILQCGDMGAFPDRGAMDKATLRHAARDRDELGFSDGFVRAKAEYAAFLDRLGLDMWCVRGNHEDHAFLDALEAQSPPGEPLFAIDAYGRVKVLKTGVPAYFEKDGDVAGIVGIGRIGDRKGRTHPQFVQDYERQRLEGLIRARGTWDVLLSHDKAGGSERGYGSDDVARVLDEIPFAYHFYGHTGEPFGAAWAENGITQSVKVRELEFDGAGRLPQGCMVVLEKSAQGWMMEALPCAYIEAFTRHTWHYL
ncbi:MAG: metallophosphoesterase [Neisseria sp.]|nr:metallophosphoesterase [Neisseria sp.]